MESGHRAVQDRVHPHHRVPPPGPTGPTPTSSTRPQAGSIGTTNDASTDPWTCSAPWRTKPPTPQPSPQSRNPRRSGKEPETLQPRGPRLDCTHHRPDPRDLRRCRPPRTHRSPRHRAAHLPPRAHRTATPGPRPARHPRQARLGSFAKGPRVVRHGWAEQRRRRWGRSAVGPRRPGAQLSASRLGCPNTRWTRRPWAFPMSRALATGVYGSPRPRQETRSLVVVKYAGCGVPSSSLPWVEEKSVDLPVAACTGRCSLRALSDTGAVLGFGGVYVRPRVRATQGPGTAYSSGR